jgi:hypothetical protein
VSKQVQELERALGVHLFDRIGRRVRLSRRALHPAVALTALADVDVELPVNGLALDLDLELLGDVGVSWSGPPQSGQTCSRGKRLARAPRGFHRSGRAASLAKPFGEKELASVTFPALTEWALSQNGDGRQC